VVEGPAAPAYSSSSGMNPPAWMLQSFW